MRLLERHHISAEAGREFAEPLVEAEHFRRMSRGKPQGVGQRHAEHPTQLRTALGHGEIGAGQFAIAPHASFAADENGLALKLKDDCVPPTGGMASVTRIGLSRGRARARRSMAGATCTPSTIMPNQACSDFQRRRDRAGLAAIERPHGIEQMGKAGQARRHRFLGLRIGRHRVAKRNAHARGRKRSDKFQRDLVRGQRDEQRALAAARSGKA